MRTRALGSTGLEVSVLALGTWGLSGDAYGPVPETEQDAVIDRALALGLNLFETADCYGKGEMERRLGRRLPKEGAFVATKIGNALGESPPRKLFDAKYLKDAAEASRERLARESIDVLLLHNPSAPTLASGAVGPAMGALVEAGIARHWGVSVGSPEAAWEAIQAGAAVIQIAYNAFHRRVLDRIAAEVQTKKIGVLARSVLGYGLLCGNWPNTKEFPADDHRADRWNADELKRRIMQLNALRPGVAGNVTTLRAAALRYVLSQTDVSSAVIGPRKTAQLDQCLREVGNEEPFLDAFARNGIDTRVINLGVKT
jgi:aryl-alcohol dehydrogenase-like predicted oxidoreductase